MRGQRTLSPTIRLMLAVLLAALGIAWQGAPPLSLAVEVDPSTVASGGKLTLTFTVSNQSDTPLQGVELTVVLPEGTELERASSPDDGWTVETLAENTLVYRAPDPLPAGGAADLGLELTVLQGVGASVILETYAATAQSLEEPVTGESLTVPVVSPAPTASETPPAATATAAPSPSATVTATASPSPTPTSTPTTTHTPTATSSPTPTATPTAPPTPTPTITIVVAELPPTVTPNLTSEQVQVGTVTVMIFVGLTLAAAVLGIGWMVRRGKGE